MNTMHAPEYVAVRHILSAPSLAERCAPHISDDDFAWAGLLAEATTMSAGEATLVRVAFDLWEAEGVVGVWELAKQLDPHNFDRVLEALHLYRGDTTADTRVPLAA